jgi:mannosyltransferase OCH1-like enzyme
MIPRVIHQTWRDADPPPAFADLTRTWRGLNPGWAWRLWTDADNREFVAREYPDLLALYDAYPFPIQRVDMVRYLILHRHGGLFVDLDFEALRPIEPFLGADAVFGCEPDENCRAPGQARIVSNAFMACAPEHPLLNAVVAALPGAMQSAVDQRLGRNAAILESTGPFFLTRCLDAYGGAPSVAVLPAKTLYPLGISEIEQLRAQGWTPPLRARLNGACAVHYHAGTWWR